MTRGATHLFSPPRKAEAMLASDAAMRAPHAKSSSLAEAMTMPPMTGMRHSIFAVEIFELYTR